MIQRDIDYFNYLDHFYQSIHQDKKNKNYQSKLNIIEPIIQYSQNKKKTKIINFIKIINSFNRNPDLFINFLKKELSIEKCSLNDNQQLTIFQFIKESIIKQSIVKFFEKFVLCKTCKNIFTSIEKDKDFKNKQFIYCNYCFHKEYLS